MAFDGTLKFDTSIDKSGFEAGLSKLGGIAKAGMAAVTGSALTAADAVSSIGKSAAEIDLIADTALNAAKSIDLFSTSSESINSIVDSAQESAASIALLGQNAAEISSLGDAAEDVANDISSLGKKSLSFEGIADSADGAAIEIAEIGNKAENVNAVTDAAEGAATAMTDLQTESEKTGNSLTSTFDKLGGIAKAGMAAVAGAITAATGAMAALGTKALEAYADYEQLTGGVATLFGAQDMSLEEYAQSVGKTVDAVKGDYDKLIAAQDAVMSNAAEAFRTAGLSQNEYMETVTSFSAALIASLGGDTAKAAEVADKAIIDMADNANKMGSSMESIQNAYQGFAKQNYTMLDNLKLGYGGTKSEMERLLADAQAISGIEYNLDSYADIVEAIHVIQDKMGITGTTAREAAETISGSVGMTKAAFSNLLVGIADDTQDFEKLVNDLVESATAAAGNILPRVETIIGGIGKLISSMSGVAADMIVGLTAYIPDLIAAGVSLVDAIADGLMQNASSISQVVFSVSQMLVRGLASISTKLLDFGASLLVSLAKGITEHLSEISETAKIVIQELTQAFSVNVPQIILAGIDIITALADSLLDNCNVIISSALIIFQTLCSSLLNGENLQKMLDSGLNLLLSFCQAFIDNLPLLIDTAIQILSFLCTELLAPDNILKILDAGVTILMSLVDAIVDNLDELLIACEQILITIADELLKPENLEKLFELGFKLLGKIIEGLCKIGGQLLGFTLDLADEMSQRLMEIDWGAMGKAIVEGICSGLLDCDFILDDFLSGFKENWLSGIKDIFGIHSPSKLMHDEVGEYLALGIGEGFADEAKKVGDSIAATVSGWTDRIAQSVAVSSEKVVSDTRAAYDKLPESIRQPLEQTILQAIQWGTNIVETAKVSASEFLDNVIEFFSELPEKAKSFLDDTISKVKQWASDLAQKGKEGAADLVQKIETEISALPQKMFDAGRNLVEGLWNGISNMGSWLKDRISSFAGGIIDGFKDAFGIESPSKVMRDSVGKYLAQGLGVGFTEEIPEIGKAALDAFADLELPKISLKAEIDGDMPDPNQPKYPVYDVPRATNLPKADVDAVRMLRTIDTQPASGLVQPSPTSEVTNNYYTSTTNNRTDSTQPVINIHVHCETEMDGEKVAEMVAEKVDILQGEAITMDERGTAH